MPDLVGRFESLQVVHEESANIINKVEKLKESQSAVLRNLGENQELLKKVLLYSYEMKNDFSKDGRDI